MLSDLGTAAAATFLVLAAWLVGFREGARDTTACAKGCWPKDACAKGWPNDACSEV